LNRSGLFFLLSAIVIAIITTWINTQWLSYKYFQLSKKEKRIDYYLSDFSLLNVQENGEMRYFVTGKHLIHQQKSGKTEIFNPVLEARSTDNTTISLVAKKAVQSTRNGNIHLEGLVVVNKESNKNEADGFTIQTSDLIYNPVKRELKSDAKLFFKSLHGSLQGIGFSSKLDEQEFRINSNVQAKYQPQN